MKKSTIFWITIFVILGGYLSYTDEKWLQAFQRLGIIILAFTIFAWLVFNFGIVFDKDLKHELKDKVWVRFVFPLVGIAYLLDKGWDLIIKFNKWLDNL